MLDLSKILNERVLLFDGAMGTMLQRRGLASGELPELLNLSSPEIITEIHRQYVLAGADVVSANTFQANELKLTEKDGVETVVSAGVGLARESGARYVALDVGPLGQLMAPMGEISFQRACEIFSRQMIAGERAGADVIILETFSDPYEMKAALLAAKENTGLPAICSMTFQEEGRTFVGCDALTATLILQGLGADAIGVNCSLGPKSLAPVVETMLKYSRVPVIMQANAGLPEMEGAAAVYNIGPEEYAAQIMESVGKGVAIVGGCCGTSPEYIRLLKERIARIVPPRPAPERTAACSSGTKTVFLGEGVKIGERLDPAINEEMKNALITGDTDYFIDEALAQTSEGADILKIGAALPDTEEPNALANAVLAVQSVTKAPLMLCGSCPEAMEAAARVYNGIPLINPVNAEGKALESILWTAEKYGGLVTGRTPVSSNGIKRY